MAGATAERKQGSIVEAMRLARLQGASYNGIWSWLTTVDHKRIGIMYGLTAFAFFLVGGIEALVIRLQLATPNGGFVDADQYNRLFTMHGATMVFLQRLVRCRIVPKVDSIGLPVRKLCQCMAGKS